MRHLPDRSPSTAAVPPPAPPVPPFPLALAVLVALVLLAFPARPGLAEPRPDAGWIVPGEVALETSDTLPSHLSLDEPTLETEICGRPDPDGGAGEVGLTITNDGSSGPFVILVLAIETREPEDTARVSAGRIHWRGAAPFATHCGRWSYAVDLDPDAVQPISALALGRAAAGAPTAAFAGTVLAAARLRFTAEDGGRSREIPLLLRLELAGRWTVARGAHDADGADGADGADDAAGALPPPLGDGDSNLVLLVEHEAGTWAPLPAVVTGGCGGGLCPAGHRLVLQAAARPVAALQGAE